MVRLLALALLVPAPAFATTGLSWQWPADGHRFLLAARVDLPAPLRIPAEKNLDLRTSLFEVTAVTSCAPVEPAPKKGFRLACTLEDVALRADEASSIEKDHIVPVLTELDEKLTGATVQILTDAEGHVKLFDLEGVVKDKERQRAQFAIARLVLMRAFVLLDFELPKAGDDRGVAWRVTNSLANGYPSDLGVSGSFPLDSVVESTDGTVVVVKQRAAGIVQSGEMSAVGSGQPTYVWDTTLDGTARFDVASGRLLERQYVVEGTPTASSLGASAARKYTQIARLVALGPTEHPALPDSGVLAN